MADSIAQFFVNLFTDVDDKGLKQTTDKLDALGDHIQGIADLAVAALTTGTFAVALQNVADRFDGLGDAVSRMSGITAHELEGIAYAASLAGSDVETATRSMEALSNTLGQAINGIGRGAAAFEAFGISVKNADGSAKDVPQVLEDIRARLADMGTTAERTAFLQRLGIDPSLLEYLTLEGEQLAALNEEYERRSSLMIFDGLKNEDGTQVQVGDDVEQALANVAGDFNDSRDRMMRGVSDIFTAFIVRLLPRLTAAFNTISNWFLQNSGKIVAFFDPIVAGIGAVIDVLTVTITMLLDFNAALGGLPGIIGAVLAAWKLLNLSFMATPIGAVITGIAALVAALALLWEDFQVWREGGESFFNWGPLVDGVKTVINWVQNLYALLDDSGIIDLFIKAFTGAFNVVAGVVGGIVSLIKGIIGFFQGALFGDWSTWDEAGQELIQRIGQIFEGLCDLVGSLVRVVFTPIRGLFNNFVEIVRGSFIFIRDLVSGFFSWLLSIPQNIIDRFLYILDPLINLFKDVVAGFKQSFDNAKAYLANLFNFDFSAVFDDISQAISEFYDRTISVFSSVKNTIVKSISGAFTSVGRVINSAVQGINNAIKFVLNFISGIVKNIIGEISTDLSLIGQAVAEVWGDVLSLVNNVIGWIGSLGAKVFTVFANAINQIPQAINNIIQLVTSGLSAIVDTLRGYLDSAISFVANAFYDLPNVLLGVVDAIYNAFADMVSRVIAVVSSLATSLFNFDLTGALSAIGNQVLSFFGNLVDTVAQMGAQMVQDFIAGFLNIGEKIKNAASGAWDWAKSKLGFGDEEAQITVNENQNQTITQTTEGEVQSEKITQTGQNPEVLPQNPPVKYDLAVNPATMLNPSTVTNNNRTINNTSTVTNNQTFNVASREEAAYISRHTMTRQPGRAY